MKELKEVIERMDEEEQEVWYRIITGADDVMRELFWSLITGDEQDYEFLCQHGLTESEAETFLELLNKIN